MHPIVGRHPRPPVRAPQGGRRRRGTRLWLRLQARRAQGWLVSLAIHDAVLPFFLVVVLPKFVVAAGAPAIAIDVQDPWPRPVAVERLPAGPAWTALDLAVVAGRLDDDPGPFLPIAGQDINGHPG